MKWGMGNLLCWIKEITGIFALFYSVEQNLCRSFCQENSALHHELPWIWHHNVVFIFLANFLMCFGVASLSSVTNRDFWQSIQIFFFFFLNQWSWLSCVSEPPFSWGQCSLCSNHYFNINMKAGDDNHPLMGIWYSLHSNWMAKFKIILWSSFVGIF